MIKLFILVTVFHLSDGTHKEQQWPPAMSYEECKATMDDWNNMSYLLIGVPYETKTIAGAGAKCVEVKASVKK